MRNNQLQSLVLSVIVATIGLFACTSGSVNNLISGATVVRRMRASLTQHPMNRDRSRSSWHRRLSIVG